MLWFESGTSPAGLCSGPCSLMGGNILQGYRIFKRSVQVARIGPLGLARLLAWILVLDTLLPALLLHE